jgi:hypothetical protein
MTIAEHAKRYLNRTNPDLDQDALARGHSVSRTSLSALRGAGTLRRGDCALGHPHGVLS